MLKVANGAKIAPSFGFSTISVNGLNVYTLTLRMRQHSLKHMAFCYVLNEQNFVDISESTKLKKGYWYVTYRFATTSHEERDRLSSMLRKAQGYVFAHEADQKLGTKTAPSFVSWYWNNGTFDIVDDLPF